MPRKRRMPRREREMSITPEIAITVYVIGAFLIPLIYGLLGFGKMDLFDPLTTAIIILWPIALPIIIGYVVIGELLFKGIKFWITGFNSLGDRIYGYFFRKESKDD